MLCTAASYGIIRIARKTPSMPPACSTRAAKWVTTQSLLAYANRGRMRRSPVPDDRWALSPSPHTRPRCNAVPCWSYRRSMLGSASLPGDSHSVAASNQGAQNGQHNSRASRHPTHATARAGQAVSMVASAPPEDLWRRECTLALSRCGVCAALVGGGATPNVG